MGEFFSEFFKRLSRKSMARAGIVGVVTTVVLIFLLISLPVSSSPVIEKETYGLGEKIRVDLNKDYRLKITTPSNTYIKKGNEKFIFKPKEIGNYELIVYTEEDRSSYGFDVVKEKKSQEEDSIGNKRNVSEDNTGSNETKDVTESLTNTPLNKVSSKEKEESKKDKIALGKPVKNSKTIKVNDLGKVSKEIPEGIKNISVYKNGKEVPYKIEKDTSSLMRISGFSREESKNKRKLILEDVKGELKLEYYTPGPEKEERKINDLEKEVKIKSNYHYENVQAWTNISENLSIRNKEDISVYWENENKYVDFNVRDKNSNGIIDRIDWNVPHLSNQTFKVIVVSKAEHLDSNRNFIKNVYEEVSEKDNDWANIPNKDYLRVKFERNLTSKNDITIYARSNSSASVGVYEKNSNVKIADFGTIDKEGKYDVLLNNLEGEQDTFDLRVIGETGKIDSSVEFDYVVDPAQYARPDSDVITGGWEDSTGGDGDGLLYDEIDEITASDTDYDRSAGNPSMSDYYEAGLSDALDPLTHTGHNVSYRARYQGGWGNTGSSLNVELREGGDLIAEWTDDLSTSWESFSHTLTTSEAEAISDYSNLRLRFGASGSAFFGTVYVDVSWAEFELPVETVAPNASLVSPEDRAITANKTIGFEGSFTDNQQLYNSTLYVWDSQGNLVNQSSGLISGTEDSTTINITLSSEDTYEWNYYVCDASGNCDWADNNRTITYTLEPLLRNLKLDATSPDNVSQDNLTCNYDLIAGSEGGIINWQRNGSSITLLNTPFEGNSSAALEDYSGLNNDLINNGATWQATSGFDGNGAFSFPGNGEELEDSDAENYINGLDEITISVWVKADSTGTDKPVFDTEQPDSQDDVLGLRYDSSGYESGCSDCIKAGLATSVDGTDVIQLESSSGLQSTNWQHLVLRWQGGSELELFVDGIKDDGAWTSQTGSGTISDATILLIGNGAMSGSAGSWDGMIDNFKIYRRHLSDNQIKAIYNNQKNTLVSDETSLADNWTCDVTPFSHNKTGRTNTSNGLLVLGVPPKLNLNPVYPTEDIGVFEKEFFNVTLNASCVNHDCGNVDIGQLANNTLISENSGTPFYTNVSNPQTVNLNQGESQDIVFWINATGDVGKEYEFYGKAYDNSQLNRGNETDSWNVTIASRPSKIKINSPEDYSEIKDVIPLLNVTLDKIVDTLWYEVDGDKHVICYDCTGTQTDYMYLEEGNFEVKVYSNNSLGTTSSNSSLFTLDMNTSYYDEYITSKYIKSFNDTTWNEGNVTFSAELVNTYFWEGWEDMSFDDWSNTAWTIDATHAQEEYSAACLAGSNCNMYSTNKIDTSNTNEIELDFRYYDHNCDGNDMFLYFNDSSGNWDEITSIDAGSLGGSYDAWNSYTVTTTDNQYFHEGFAIRFEGDPDSTWFSEENYWLDNINLSYQGYNDFSGGFTSYTINTLSPVAKILDVGWEEIGTDSTKNITVEISADNGQNWYEVSQDQGLSSFNSGYNLIYRVLFQTDGTGSTIGLENLTINWSDETTPPPNITINSPRNETVIKDVIPLLNVTLEGNATKTWYTTDGGETNITLCTDCIEGQDYTDFMHLKEGNFTVDVYASDNIGSTTRNSSSFTLDMNESYSDEYNTSKYINKSNGTTWNEGNVTFSAELVNTYFWEDWESQDFDDWSNTAWTIDSTQAQETYSSLCSTDSNCDMYSINKIDTSNTNEIELNFKYYDDDCDSNDVFLYFNDSGGNWNEISSIDAGSLESSDDVWNTYTVTTTDNQYFHEGFAIRFEATPDSGPWENENYWIDNINVTYQDYGSLSGSFTSYVINTVSLITKITNVDWTSFGTDTSNNVSIKVSADEGQNWYDAVKGQAIDSITPGYNLIYKVLFETNQGSNTVGVENLTINWSDEINPPANITINSPLNGSTFQDVTPLLNVTLEGNATEAWYSTNGGETNITLCTNCVDDQDYTDFMHLKEGDFTVEIYTKNVVNDKSSNSSSFTIDMNRHYYDSFNDNSSLLEDKMYNVEWNEGNVSLTSTTPDSGNFTAYPINVSQPIKAISNISWNESGTDANNNITVDLSVDGGNTWYDATNGGGVDVGSGNSLVYRVFFNTDGTTNVSLLDMDIKWSEPPEVDIKYPGPYIYNYTLTQLNYTVSSASSSLDSCWWTNDSGQTNYSISCGENITTSSIEGTNTWTVYSNDTEGAIGSDTIQFIVDLTAPNVSLINQTGQDGEVINQSNPLYAGGNLTLRANVSDNNTENVWITIWEGAKGGVEKVTKLLTYVAGGAYWMTQIQTDSIWNNFYNYTIYANDTAGWIGEYDGNFSIMKINSNISLNPNPIEGTGDVTALGHVNFTNSSGVKNHPVNIWLDGELLLLDNISGDFVNQDVYQEFNETDSEDFNEGSYSNTTSNEENLTLESGQTSGTFTKTLDAGARVEWDSIQWDYSGQACSASLSYQQGADNFTGTEDSYVDGDMPGSNYGNDSQLSLDTSPARRSLIKFDVVGYGEGKVPYDSTINEANISVNVFDTGDVVSVYSVAGNWSEDSITFNNAPSRAAYLEDSFSPSSTGTYNFDITHAMTDWVNQTRENHGVYLYPGGTNRVNLRSSEYSTISQRPQLNVDFSSEDCTSIRVYVRTSNDKEDWSEWKKVSNGGQVSDIRKASRYLQYKVEMNSFNNSFSPELENIVFDYNATVTDSEGNYNYSFQSPGDYGDYSVCMNTSYATMSTQSCENLSVETGVVPIVDLIGPSDEEWLNISSFNLTYDVNDLNDDITGSTLLINGQANKTNSTPIINDAYNNFSINFSQGGYNWTVNVTDKQGNIGTDTKRRFYIDTQNPDVSLISPENDSTYELAELNLSFNTTDNMDDSLSCDVVLDGNELASGISVDNGTRENVSSGTLQGGMHYWNVTCSDEAGNSFTSDTWQFNISDTPPEVSLVWPEENYLDTDGNISFIFNATDNVGFNNCSLFINGSFYSSNQTPINNGGNTTIDATDLSEGHKNWTVECFDLNGNPDKPQTRNFSVDLSPPEIQLSSPFDDAVLNYSDVRFNFTATDNVDDSLTCNILINGNPSVSNFEATSGELTSKLVENISDGQKNWSVSCVDDAGYGNTSSQRQITVEDPPNVYLNTFNESWFSESSFSLYYTPKDNGKLSSCDLYIDNSFEKSNSSQIDNGGINNFEVSGLEEGEHSWYVNCSDGIGLSNVSETRIFYKDSTPPSVNLHYPDGQDVYKENISFNFTAIDFLDDSMTCNLSVDNIIEESNITAQNDSITSVNIANLSDGYHEWNVSCQDSSGNIGTSGTNNFTRKTIPKVDLISPEDEHWFNITNFNLTYLPQDDVGLTKSYLIINREVNKTNSTPILNNQNNTFNVNFQEGKYNWTVNVTDTTGLNGTAPERRFYVDTNSPDVTLNYPNESANLSTNNVSFDFTPKDNLDEELSCTLTLNGEEEFSGNITNGTAFTYNSLLSDGYYVWNVTCEDSARNSFTSETRNFTVKAPPNVVLDSPSEGGRTNSSELTFVYTPEDPIGISECELYIDGSLNDTEPNPVANEKNNFTVSGINEGEHNWTVNCTDFDNNYFKPNASVFYVDKSGPKIELMNPENNSGVDFNQNEVVFEWNATDEFSDFLSCNLTVDGIVESSVPLVSSGTPHEESVSGLSLGEHSWNVTCWDDDFESNVNTSETWSFNYTYPDFQVNSSLINFNNSEPAEGESVRINVTINNLGGVFVDDVTVRFYNGDPDAGGVQIGNDKLMDLEKYGSNTTGVVWSSEMGSHEIFVVVDPPVSTNGSFEEWNESNNKGSKNVTIGSWNYFYGNIGASSNFTLADNDSRSIIRWDAKNYIGGNIYASDYEGSVSWKYLQAIGKTPGGGSSSEDFSEIDDLLNMSSYNDSVSNVYAEGGVAENTSDFRVFKENITGVPIAESINNSNFTTGILWDTSNDTDGEYSQTDKEDLVFVTKINKDTKGTYGVYDYEIRIPARLREYETEDTESAVFYVELR